MNFIPHGGVSSALHSAQSFAWLLAFLLIVQPVTAHRGVPVFGGDGERGLYSVPQAVTPNRPDTAVRVEPKTQKLALPRDGGPGPISIFAQAPSVRHAHTHLVAEAWGDPRQPPAYASRAPPVGRFG